jgi:hypothetical protein
MVRQNDERRRREGGGGYRVDISQITSFHIFANIMGVVNYIVVF